jgi:hypothetical protein
MSDQPDPVLEAMRTMSPAEFERALDEVAELVWEAVNDVAGRASWSWEDVPEAKRRQRRADVREAFERALARSDAPLR